MDWLRSFKNGGVCMGKYLVIATLAVAGLFIFGFGGGKSGLVSYEELQAKLAKKDKFVLLDVRTPDEFAEGHIAGAVLLPYDQVEQKAASMLPEKEKPIIVYCRSGRRSAIAADALRGLGYKDVKDFGGISRWQGALER